MPYDYFYSIAPIGLPPQRRSTTADIYSDSLGVYPSQNACKWGKVAVQLCEDSFKKNWAYFFQTRCHDQRYIDCQLHDVHMGRQTSKYHVLC